MEADIMPGKRTKADKKPRKKRFLNTKSNISFEDYEIVAELDSLNKEIKSLHNCLNNVTDPTLIDSYIYEIQALNMRYKYYLKECKAKGIIAGGFQEACV